MLLYFILTSTRTSSHPYTHTSFPTPYEDECEIWSELESDSDRSIHDRENEEEPANSLPLEESNHEISSQNALASWLTITILFMQVRFRLTTKFVSALFRLVKVFLEVIGRFCTLF